MNVLRLILSLILLIASIYIGYLLFKTIEEPIVFEEQRIERDDAAIAKLKKVRASQIAFKNIHGRYAGNFDTLLTVIKSDSFNVVKQIGDPNDTTKVSKTVITRVAILDSLFEGSVKNAEDMTLVPFTNNEPFDIEAKMITKNQVEVPAFEVSTPYPKLYNGLIAKYYQNKADKRMKVGSLEEGTTTGNWEK